MKAIYPCFCFFVAINWCLEQGFEFVELNPREDDSSESDLEDDFVETVGVKRISQALQAHIWPNMIPKCNSLSLASY